jgi:hypothetical protein
MVVAIKPHTATATMVKYTEYGLALTALPAFAGAARAVTADPTSKLSPFYHSGNAAQVPALKI